MTISRFLKNVREIERTAYIDVERQELNLFEDSQEIRWPLLDKPQYTLFYCFSDTGASLYIKNGGSDKKLAEIKLKIDDNPANYLVELLSRAFPDR